MPLRAQRLINDHKKGLSKPPKTGTEKEYGKLQWLLGELVELRKKSEKAVVRAALIPKTWWKRYLEQRRRQNLLRSQSQNARGIWVYELLQLRHHIELNFSVSGLEEGRGDG